MINAAISDVILDRVLRPEDRVLDVGGGRFPWFRATHVLDRRGYEQMVRPIAFAGRTGERERFGEETWVVRDFYDLPWPFPDGFFDFSICMGTLEDLRDPLPICEELVRVSKAGYISTPTRAAESCFGVSRHPDTDGLPGYFHHRWFVEIDGGELAFTMKHPLLSQHREHAVDDFHQHTLNFFWRGGFGAKEKVVSSIPGALADLERFAGEHGEWRLRSEAQPSDPGERYNRWPAEWGERPVFLELPGVAGCHPAEELAKAASGAGGGG
mgnify:CR=1 FL=1